MNKLRYEIVLHRRERDYVTLERLAASAGLHPTLVERFVEFGLLDPVEWAGTELFFDVAAVMRLRLIERLRRDIGLNLAGVSVVLDMLDRLCALQRENEWLRSRL
jgi:MerR family transcriptional regulator, heat shock protein HspR